MSDAYSRLYHRFAKEYPAVYSDDRALAAWVRLLMLADAAWPIRPPLPRSVRRPILAKLNAGDEPLVIVDDDTYTVRGLDAERIRRSNAGRKGAAVRWDSERNAAGNATADATAMPRRDETRRDEDSPPPQVGRRKDGTNARAQGANPRANGTSPRQVKAAEKRGGLPPTVGELLRRANEAGRPK